MMLGIQKSDDVFYVNWLMAWFEILDNLFSILTFNRYYMDLSGRIFFSENSIFGKCNVKPNTITFCLISGIEILESLFAILTLGFLEADWAHYFFGKKEG